jgi:peroxiredoxin
LTGIDIVAQHPRKVPSLRFRVEMFALLTLALASAPAVAETPLQFRLPDVGGRIHDASELAGHPATVFVFIEADCPISNGYVPELNRIAQEYAAREVRLFAVYSGRASAEELAAHARDYALGFPALVDREQVLAARLGITTTPEVAVVSGGSRLLYRGRIDDRHVDLGVARAEPRRRDLRLALDEALAGHAVTLAETPAVGCALPRKRP